MAGQSGIIYDYIVYQGAETETNKVFTQYADGAGPVMHLEQRIEGTNNGLHFDN